VSLCRFDTIQQCDRQTDAPTLSILLSRVKIQKQTVTKTYGKNRTLRSSEN